MYRFLILFAPVVWGIAIIISLFAGKYNDALLEFVILTYALKEYADLKIKELQNEISTTL